MKNLFPILLLSLFLLSCSEEQNKPNFVFILVDDLGWADVQFNNPNSFYETPNLNKLAESGIIFTNGYAANPVCSPSRAALMTGKHPNNVNITDWIPGKDPKNRKLLGPQDANELALDEITLAEKLKEKGYKTCFVGKWHLGGEGFLPKDQGFDINLGGWHWGAPKKGYFAPYKNPRLAEGPKGEYLTDRLTNESIRFITENKGHQPFLLYLSYYTVHTPIHQAPNHIEHYIEKRKKLGLDSIPHKKEGNGYTKLIQENASFASMVTAMDYNVGKLLAALKNQGLAENTWVIFTSDNGGLSTLTRRNAPTCNLPLRAGKGWCYEGGIRVPLVISGPGLIKKGTKVNDIAVGMDFYPTILELAGVESNDVDGTSLLPILKTGSNLERDEMFWHYPHYHGSAWTPGAAIRSAEWKLITFYEDNRFELYNLKEDQGETSDLSAQNPEKLEEMKLKLKKWYKKTNARFPIENPDFEKK